jgi:hypothetical protein
MGSNGSAGFTSKRLTWKGFSKALLFIWGMAGGVAAGHLFYLERYPAGLAMFALTALFLYFAVGEPRRPRRDDAGDNVVSGGKGDRESTLRELALLVSENAVTAAKNIGRTLPCTPTELSKLEDRLVAILDELDVPAEGKNAIVEEIEKLRTRTRQLEGRRALSGRF